MGKLFYVVTFGMYSDYTIVGITTDKTKSDLMPGEVEVWHEVWHKEGQ